MHEIWTTERALQALTRMTRKQLSYPTDIERAARRWQANCGPCALAAVLGVPVQRAQALLPDWPGYTTITCVKAALARVTAVGARLPSDGLVFLQWGGHDHKPVKAQYRSGRRRAGCSTSTSFGQKNSNSSF
jgi:hypothetical protein